MKRRQVLLGSAVVLGGVAGCSKYRSGTTPNTTRSPSETRIISKTRTSSETTTSSPGPSERKTPPADFHQKWTFDEDDDWTERRRRTEYPDSDDAVDWTPDYARSAEYSHAPSREELAGTVDASDVPSVVYAISSKWALPVEFSDTSVGLVAEVRDWFMNQFDSLHFDFGSPENVEPSGTELESGRSIGFDRYELEGDTGQLDHPFRATVNDETIEVNRVSYESEGRLLGLVDRDERIGYLAGGGWPVDDTVTLHTGDGAVNVSATVSGESWEVEDHLVGALEEIDRG